MHETTAERILHESLLQQHWLKRIIAIVIDSIIVGIATTIMGYLINIGGIFNWLNFPFAMKLIYVLYFTTTELMYGHTMGKKMVNLKVVSADGKKPSSVVSFSLQTLIKNILTKSHTQQ